MSVIGDCKDVFFDMIDVKDDFETIKKQFDIALEIMFVTRDPYDMEIFIREWLLSQYVENIEITNYLLKKRYEYIQMI